MTLWLPMLDRRAGSSLHRSLSLLLRWLTLASDLGSMALARLSGVWVWPGSFSGPGSWGLGGLERQREDEYICMFGRTYVISMEKRHEHSLTRHTAVQCNSKVPNETSKRGWNAAAVGVIPREIIYWFPSVDI